MRKPRKVDRRTRLKLDQAILEMYRNQAQEMIINGLKKRNWADEQGRPNPFQRNAVYRLSDSVSVTVK